MRTGTGLVWAVASGVVAVAVAATCASELVAGSRDALRDVSTASERVAEPVAATEALARFRDSLGQHPDAIRCLHTTAGDTLDPACRAALAPAHAAARVLLQAERPAGAASPFAFRGDRDEIQPLMDEVTRVSPLASEVIREALGRGDLVAASALCAAAVEHGVSLARQAPGLFGASVGLIVLRNVRASCVETLAALDPDDRARLAEALHESLAAFPAFTETAENEKLASTAALCGLVASEQEVAALSDDARRYVELHRSSPDPLELGILDPVLRKAWASASCQATRAYVDAFVHARTATDAAERARWERVASWYGWMPGAGWLREGLPRFESESRESLRRLEAELR
jgi:hypothetical protein